MTYATLKTAYPSIRRQIRTGVRRFVARCHALYADTRAQSQVRVRRTLASVRREIRQDIAYNRIGLAVLGIVLIAEMMSPATFGAAGLAATAHAAPHAEAVIAQPASGPRAEYAFGQYDPLPGAFDGNDTSLPADARPVREMWVPSTAYTSRVAETDGTPFITGSGTHVRHGVLAANFLPIGTKVRIPDYYGDQVFIVEDRMNARYWYKIDVWMDDLGEARQWGSRTIRVEIY